jgi:hypothetical protein
MRAARQRRDAEVDASPGMVTNSVSTLVAVHGLDREGVDPAGATLAATALALAGELDSPRGSATAKATCARSLLEVLDRLREQHPGLDRLDEIAARRAARLAGNGGVDVTG